MKRMLCSDCCLLCSHKSKILSNGVFAEVLPEVEIESSIDEEDQDIASEYSS